MSAVVRTIRNLVLEGFLNTDVKSGDYQTDIEGVTLYCRQKTQKVENCFYKPSIILVLQGAKRTQIGSEIFEYSKGDIMVMGVDLPASSTILEASVEQPYLSVGVEIDSSVLVNLVQETTFPNFDLSRTAKGIFVQKSDFDLLDAFLRLIKLLKYPERIGVLGPMVIREIHYLLLIGSNGDNLSLFHTVGYKSSQVVRAISMIRDHLKKPFSVDEIAQQLNMASSTFHRHFKQATNMSPLQYLKQLRLHEAQKLMLTEGFNSGRACAAVGYESISQFNREYKRLFGDPPHKDITKLKNNV
ncbi:AraC family transcriptional regulator [Maridesulfovibrio sp.]|uniref:AraC family transcriptional regulator n=1 Tax=Maridesulfovibrio sp. TaxID=2795000 RepID=UPI0029F4C2FF|nr:AraC family transcriptional regulator [Maridesulfovibrio sp.]